MPLPDGPPKFRPTPTFGRVEVVKGSPPILAPVPLHRWRIWRRGYNQSHALAHGLARELKAKVIFDGRNLYEPRHVRAAGVDYLPIGRP